MPQDFQNKIVWLTGASSGIGLALAHELARRGAILALTSRRAEELGKLVSTISQSGARAYSFPADVQFPEQVQAAARAIEEKVGQIDILISNAGTHLFTVPEKFDSAEYLQIMNLNYGGLLHCIEAVLPKMINRRSGHIVGVASLAGYRGLPRAAAYGASKAAMNNFLESLRFHAKEYSIDVTVVNPGFVKTPLTDKNDFFMPFLISPEKAADCIARGVLRRAREVSFPFPFNWIIKIGRVLPHAVYDRIVDRLW